MKHEPALDGLRALAVIGVVLAHTGAGVIGGGRGVDVFFVLSGFLITRILMQGPALFDFWGRRVRRLIPALLVLLFAYLAVGQALFPNENHPKEALLTLLYSNNWSLAFDPRHIALGHTWSLAIEEQFYLVWPFVVPLLLKAKQPVAWLVLLWLLFALSRQLAPGADIPYYATPFHATGLIAGAIVAFRLPPASLGWLGLGAIAVSFFVGGPGHGAEAIPLTEIGTALLIPALLQPSRLQSAFAWKPAAWIGLVSYGIYLWHWPIAMLAEGRWYSAPVTLVASVVLAALSYYLVEQRFRYLTTLRESQVTSVAKV